MTELLLTISLYCQNSTYTKSAILYKECVRTTYSCLIEKEYLTRPLLKQRYEVLIACLK